MLSKNKLVIIGAGGHGRVCEEIAWAEGFHDIVFLDDDITLNSSGMIEDYLRFVSEVAFFVAIGDNKIRRIITNRLIGGKANIISLKHPSAIISRNVKIGFGTVIMPGTVINTGTIIGDGVIINTGSTVDHDCIIGNFVHISVGSHLAGTVCIDDDCFIGAGTTIINNINICAKCVVGAGGTVISDLQKIGTYVGTPVKLLEAKESK